MLISWNWLRDFVDLPVELTPVQLADRFTMVCAEVEGIERIEVNARGLICARIESVLDIDGQRDLNRVALNVGGGESVETISAAPGLKVGQQVVFAPIGASVRSLGQIVESNVAGFASRGMILPGEALGMALSAREALFLASNVHAGDVIDSEPFDDWVIEVDNHSINHRPDLWGHYGIAREIAAIYGKPLRPYTVTPLSELENPDLPVVPIEITDPDQCPRYSGLLMASVKSKPSPLWMQLRLGHVGLRPIDGLVDLTNYIMLELGQPMHAFDADTVDGIEVRTVAAGTKMTTLDHVERTLPEGALVIACRGRPIALAGIMGGAETEITTATKSMLLESANFNPHTIRKCAANLGHRTDASARFEKSLDPAHTVLAIQRFVHLGRREYPDLKLASRLSDAYPKRLPEVVITLDPEQAVRVMGHPVSRERIGEILTALAFKVSDDGARLRIEVPSFRATRDIEIEADIIEEVARYVGYDNIEPSFPEVTVRALERNPLQQLERRMLRLLTEAAGMIEIHSYLWFDSKWCDVLGYEPGSCLSLRNPAAAGLQNMRTTMLPNLLSAADLNRHHWAEFRLFELGSIFPIVNGTHAERRCLGMIIGRREKNAEDECLAELKQIVDLIALRGLAVSAAYRVAESGARAPWEHPFKTTDVLMGGRPVGRASVVPLELRRRIDDHLAAWTLVWAEIELDGLAAGIDAYCGLTPIPTVPEVEIDFSVVVDAARRYAEIEGEVAGFADPLLRRITFVDAYEGKSVPDGKRALTFRTRIGHAERTLDENDVSRFRKSFESHLAECGATLRGSY